MSSSSSNPFSSHLSSFTLDGQEYKYYSLRSLGDSRIKRLPYSIKVLLESAVRNADNFSVTEKDVEKILDWSKTHRRRDVEIPFKPARVLMQDFTGVPAVVDLAAMRGAMKRLGGDPNRINPLVPADLVIDHSVQVDYSRTAEAFKANLGKEMERNAERFRFLKWGSKSFQNFLIVPPGSGIVHQVNLEYLARVVFNTDGVLYPDSVVGTDSHTTMINGLGVVGWGVGGIEAEAVMLGQPVSMVLPPVVGYRLTGKIPQHVTATDVVLTITERLRQKGVVEQFVEFFGPGLAELSLADRATIANMAPEYGATVGFFPVDIRTIEYLENTNRDATRIRFIERYLKEQDMFVDHQANQEEAEYTDVLELDLSTIVPSVAGPKRPHDRVAVSAMTADFTNSLTAPVGFKGYGLKAEDVAKRAQFDYNGQSYELSHGSVVIAAITSCTNTSNPSVMLGAGLLAKNAIEKGLKTQEFIKTSLAPGSGAVTKYLEASGLQPFLDQLGFALVGYGCTTCIGNSGDIPAEVSAAIEKNDLVAAAVLSGNRNFEGRVHPFTRANYLASPPLVVAYALAGNVNVDFESQPLGIGKDGKPVFLRDIWPSAADIQAIVAKCVVASMFKEVYNSITQGSDEWNQLDVTPSSLYEFDEKSTYIHEPPFFTSMTAEAEPIKNIDSAYCLLNLGDSITTDHISPAGDIAKSSPAAKFLQERGVAPKDFNSYGARRGNDLVMARGTFANIRLVNKLVPKPGPNTIHIPSGEQLPIFEAAQRYMEAKQDSIILAGKDYGSGSSRDWAAKGPKLQGVKAVIAVSFERIHRSNLIGMGIIPLVFINGQSADSLGLTGRERFSIDLTSGPLETNQILTVKVEGGAIAELQVMSRLDTVAEIAYFTNGGVLPFVIRKLIKQ